MNKIIINEKEYELSAELAEKIKAEVALQEKAEAERLAKQEPFARVKGKPYFLINGVGKVSTLVEGATNMDDELYLIANYCHDRGMIERRALHETLNRLLWRYSIKYDGEIICCGLDYLYEISYNIPKHEFEVMWTNTRIGEGVVYFKKQETARSAIKKVIEPFLEEHPEFHYF